MKEKMLTYFTSESIKVFFHIMKINVKLSLLWAEITSDWWVVCNKWSFQIHQ